MANIAFIGLGNMGGPMVANLVKAGDKVTGFDLVEASRNQAKADGAGIADSAAAAVKGADIVITMLPAGKHVLSVWTEILPAMTKGGSFPDGSVLVFDLLEAREENGAYAEGSRKLLGVMVKDRQRYKLTGGWGFEAFKGDSRTERTVTDAAGQCFGCHQQQKANDFVFSGFHP